MNTHKIKPFLLVVYFIVPLIVALVFHPIWRFSRKGFSEPNTAVALITMTLNFVIIPTYLVIMTKIATKNDLHLALCIILSIVVLYGSICIQYWNWGIATGMLKNPDSSTILVYKLETIVSSIILGIGLFIVAVTKK